MQKMTRNQGYVVNNKYQGLDLRVLCLCTVGVLRSPTLANVLHEDYGFNVRSCGVDLDWALIPVSEALVCWAERLVFVDRQTYLDFMKLSPKLEDREVQVLNIPDDYEYGTPELKKIIRENVKVCEIYLGGDGL